MLNPWDHYAVYEWWVWKIRIASTNHPPWKNIIEYSESLESMRKQLTEMMYTGKIPYQKYIELLDAITSMVDERWSIDPISYARDGIERLYERENTPNKTDVISLLEYCLSQYSENLKKLSIFFDMSKPKPKSSIDLEKTVVALNQHMKLSNIEISRYLEAQDMKCDRRRVHKILKAHHVVPIDGRAKRYRE